MELVRELDRRIPERCPRFDDDPREVLWHAAQRDLVRTLLSDYGELSLEEADQLATEDI